MPALRKVFPVALIVALIAGAGCDESHGPPPPGTVSPLPGIGDFGVPDASVADAGGDLGGDVPAPPGDTGSTDIPVVPDASGDLAPLTDLSGGSDLVGVSDLAADAPVIPCSSTCAAPTPACDTTTGTCVACVANSDCPIDNLPNCDRATHTCKGCSASTDCRPAAPLCNPGGVCVFCLTGAECPMATPFCSTATGYCVATCTSNGNCGPPQPICDTPRMLCVECTQDSDCPNGGNCRMNSCR